MPTFNQPDNSTEYWRPRDFIGQLCAFEVTAYDQAHTTPLTKPGEEGAAIAHVHVITGPKRGTVFLAQAINWTAIRSALRESVGGWVLGRIVQLPGQPGKSGAFILEEFTPEDAKLADAFFAGEPEPAPAQPAAYQPPLPGTVDRAAELERELAALKAQRDDPAPY